MSEKESSKSWDRLEASLLGGKPKAHSSAPPKNKNVSFPKVGFIALAIAIVLTVVAIANIPYRVVRDPVVQTTPLLLFPSMLSWDWQCSQAISKIEEAELTIDQAKQIIDLDTARNLLAATQKHLDTLPATGTPANHLWGGGMVSCPNRSELQARMQKLGTRLSNEQIAQVQFSMLHNSLMSIKAQYQQAQTPDLKKFAQGEWLTVLNRLNQFPLNTLAGRQAQAEITREMQEFYKNDKPE